MLYRPYNMCCASAFSWQLKCCTATIAVSYIHTYIHVSTYYKQFVAKWPELAESINLIAEVQVSKQGKSVMYDSSVDR
jgi:hypothetical protein